MKIRNALRRAANVGRDFLTNNKVGVALGAGLALTSQAHATDPDAFSTATTVETAALTLIGVVISTGVIRVGWRIARRYLSGL